MNEVKNSLETGDNVYLRGFGSFIVKLELKNWKKYFQNTTIKFLHTTFLHSNLQKFC
jgi:DNA-binding protein HU-beta